MNETLPCPFCGSVPKVESKFSVNRQAFGDRAQATLYWIVCSNSACRVGLSLGEYELLSAIARWNKRPGEAKLIAALADVANVASGVRQVAEDDTGGMAWISDRIKREIPR